MHYETAKANAHDQLDKRRALRREMTLAETLLWKMLRGRSEGRLRWRRQQGIGPYILDFYCSECKLCVELDGNSHDYKFEYDEQRTAYLKAQGIKVIRFSNDQVLSCLDGVVAAIARAAGDYAANTLPHYAANTPPPTPPLTGAGGTAEGAGPTHLAV